MGKAVDESTTQTPRAAPVKSALRTLQILEALSGSASRKSVATLSRDLQIPKSSLHGILRTMEAHGWLETDTTGTLYRLGLRALLTGTAYVESDDIVTLTQMALDSLSDRFGETVHLGRLDGPNVIYLAKRESAHALRLYSAVGRRLPRTPQRSANRCCRVIGRAVQPDDEGPNLLRRPRRRSQIRLLCTQNWRTSATSATPLTTERTRRASSV